MITNLLPPFYETQCICTKKFAIVQLLCGFRHASGQTDKQTSLSQYFNRRPPGGEVNIVDCSSSRTSVYSKVTV